jgi:hypothetical protein
MNKVSFLSLTILATISVAGYSTAAYAVDNFKVKNMAQHHDIAIVITNPYDNNYIEDLGTVEFGGEEYSGPIPFNHPFYMTIFYGSNPKGFLYEIAINPKKTKTIFLEWHYDTKTLRPQKTHKKRFFSKNTNIKKSEIIPESQIKPKTLAEIINYFEK